MKLSNSLLSLAVAAALAPTVAHADRDDSPNCTSGVATANVKSDDRDSISVTGLAVDQNGVQSLVCFSEKKPGKARTIGLISNTGGSPLVGIDYRVQDGKLYGVSADSKVYTIDTTTGAATLVNALSVPLSGTAFGVDFNPAANRLRIVSDTGQNLRHDLASTTIADMPLNNGSGTAVTGVVSGAYTNNDLVADTATTLFVLNTGADQIAIQSPANAGIVVPTGATGVNLAGGAGFDIYSTLVNGVTVRNKALAVGKTATEGSVLYRVELTTGKLESRGAFRGLTVTDIAIPLNQD